MIHKEAGNMIEYTVKVHGGGTKEWFLNGELHREDGPAFEGTYGSKYWYINGELHREDGPAIECANGDKYWYLNDVQYTEEEYYNKINPKAKELTMEELAKELGYNVKIIKGE